MQLDIYAVMENILTPCKRAMGIDVAKRAKVFYSLTSHNFTPLRGAIPPMSTNDAIYFFIIFTNKTIEF